MFKVGEGVGDRNAVSCSPTVQVKFLLLLKEPSDKMRSKTKYLAGLWNLLFAKMAALEPGPSSVSSNDSASQPHSLFQCSECPETYRKKHGHSLGGKGLSKTPCLYAGCEKEFFYKSKLYFHLEQDHGASLEAINHSFSSVEEFDSWKEQVEGEQTVYFSKQFKSTTSKVGTTSHFICQRDGDNKMHRKVGENPKSTRRNKKGKVKEGIICPARMKALFKSDGSAQVKF